MIPGTGTPSTVTPYSLNATSNTWSNNGITWTSSASSLNQYTTINAAFYPGGWYSWWAGSYSASTTVSGVSITGEWIQIQSSTPLYLNNYALVTRGTGGTGTFSGSTFNYNYIAALPSTYTIAGSTDGTTWTKLQSASIIANPMPTTNNGSQTSSFYTLPTSGTVTQFSNNSITGYTGASNSYTYFRLISNNNTVIGNQYGGTTDSGLLLMMGWYPNFTTGPPVPPTILSSVSVLLDNSYQNQLDVSGAMSIIGDVSLNSRLFVGQDTSLNGSLFVKSRTIQGGDVSMNSRLFLSSDASFGGQLYVVGDVSLNGNVFVTTQAAADNSTKVATTQYVTTALSAFSGAYATFQGDVSINNRLFVGSDVSLGGNVFINSKTIQGGDVSMNSRLYIGSDVSINGNLTTSIISTIQIPNYVVNQINFGQGSFTQSNVTRPVNSVSVCGTGQYSIGEDNTSALYTSNNYGQTWIKPSGVNFLIAGSAISYTGQYCVARGLYPSYGLYYSSNYGQTWTLSNLTSSGSPIASMSYNGQYVITGTSSGLFILQIMDILLLLHQHLVTQQLTILVGRQCLPADNIV